MTLQAKIDLVKRTLQERFPGCRYTIKVTIWDDGIDEVKGLHRDDDKMHVFTYFDEEMDYDIVSLKKEPQAEIKPEPVEVKEEPVEVKEPEVVRKEFKFEDLNEPHDHLGSEPIFKGGPLWNEEEEDEKSTEVVMVEGHPIERELMQERDYPEPPDEPMVPSVESMSTWERYRAAVKKFFKKHKNDSLNRAGIYKIGSYIIIPYCGGTFCEVTDVEDNYISYKYLVAGHYTGDYMRDHIGHFYAGSENGLMTRLATEQEIVEKLEIYNSVEQ